MTLEEAIQAMEDERNNIPVIPHSKLRNAHLLGIEAMKTIRSQRRTPVPYTVLLLPGET